MVGTLPDILDCVNAVLAADPLNLTPSSDPFSARKQSTLVVNRAYWIDDGGIVSNRPMGAHRAARIDALELSVLLQRSVDRATAKQEMLTLLQSVERALIADGEAQGYHVALAGRSVKAPTGRDYLVGLLRFTVDYDFSEAQET